MKSHIKKGSTIIILNMLAFVMTSAIYAKGDGYVKDGTYLGVFFTKNNMSGDFDDTEYLYGSMEINDVPYVDNDTGFGFVLGGRVADGAVEFGYQRSKHKTNSILFGESEASYNVIDFNCKFDVFAQKRIRPYILFGFGIPWLTVEDGMMDLYPPEEEGIRDETFIGFALNAGCGLAYYFHPQWAITGGVIKRWNWFTLAEGDAIDDLSEKTFCLNIGIAYTF